MRIGPVAWDSGALSGSKTIPVTFDAIDISAYSRIEAELRVNTADTDTVDTLDAVFQITRDGTIWNTVGAWPQIIGTMSPSGSAPEIRDLIIQNPCNEVVSNAFEPSGSSGGTPLVAGTVRNVPFPSRAYSNGVCIAGFRVVLTVVDADSDAQFAGSVTLFFS